MGISDTGHSFWMDLKPVVIVTDDVQELEVAKMAGFSCSKFFVILALFNAMDVVLEAVKFVTTLTDHLGTEPFLASWTAY